VATSLFDVPFAPAALALTAIGALFFVAGIVALWRRRPLRFVLRTLAGALLLTLGASTALLGLGIQGYRALTHEEVAARIDVRPTAPQRFDAIFRFADGRTSVVQLAGDEIYVDAHILKWKPWANVVGLHTAYELDRVAGRYRAIEQERSAARTVHALGRERPVDLFDLRQRYAWLAPLVDAEYGSATFVPADRPKQLELRISTTGLLMRETAAAQ
jgi:hypothetical protein